MFIWLLFVRLYIRLCVRLIGFISAFYGFTACHSLARLKALFDGLRPFRPFVSLYHLNECDSVRHLATMERATTNHPRKREHRHEPPHKQERANTNTTQPNTDGNTVKSLVILNNKFINTKQAKNTKAKTLANHLRFYHKV